MLEAATAHMGARQQAYRITVCFNTLSSPCTTVTQNFLFTAMYKSTICLTALHQIKERGREKGAVFQYRYLSVKLHLTPTSCAVLTKLLISK